jgi:putative hydrolase of the HAD superfamily
MRIPENIIFDLGGVLLNIDYDKTEKAFEDLGFSGFTTMYNQFAANALFENLETGKITPDRFYEELLLVSGKQVSRQQVWDAWNAMLLDFRETSLALLEKLSVDHRLYLLSNTNAIHHEAFMKIFEGIRPGRNFDSYFTKAYYSHDVGLRKPGREVFDFVLQDAGLNAASTLFIDDSFNNIDGAKKAGLLTKLLLPGETIEETLG